MSEITHVQQNKSNEYWKSYVFIMKPDVFINQKAIDQSWRPVAKNVSENSLSLKKKERK